ncbi:MAG: hypothetical protein WCP58_10175 [bacterium]
MKATRSLEPSIFLGPRSLLEPSVFLGPPHPSAASAVTRRKPTALETNAPHRLENVGKIPVHLIEVQNSEYLGEDDIDRFTDDFGR